MPRVTGSPFRSMPRRHMGAQAENKFNKMLNKFDANGDQKLDRDEVKALTDAMSQRTGRQVDADRLISKFDQDGDGAIDRGEFGRGHCRRRLGMTSSAQSDGQMGPMAQGGPFGEMRGPGGIGPEQRMERMEAMAAMLSEKLGQEISVEDLMELRQTMMERMRGSMARV